MKQVFTNNSSKPKVFTQQGYEIRLDPFKRGMLKVVTGCGKKNGLCLTVTTIEAKNVDA